MVVAGCNGVTQMAHATGILPDAPLAAAAEERRRQIGVNASACGDRSARHG